MQVEFIDSKKRFDLAPAEAPAVAFRIGTPTIPKLSKTSRSKKNPRDAHCTHNMEVIQRCGREGTSAVVQDGGHLKEKNEKKTKNLN